MGVYGSTQEMTGQYTRSSTIQGCHWVDTAGPMDFSIYVKLKERQDGGVDRTIVYQLLPHRLAAN